MFCDKADRALAFAVAFYCFRFVRASKVLLQELKCSIMKIEVSICAREECARSQNIQGQCWCFSPKSSRLAARYRHGLSDVGQLVLLLFSVSFSQFSNDGEVNFGRFYQ